MASASDISSERYCFSSPEQSNSARQKVAAIQVPSDVVTTDGNCLVIQMSSHRRELIQRFILSTFPGAHVQFSSEHVRKEACHLKVEKIKVKNNDELTVNAGKFSRLNKTQIHATQNEISNIQTINDFELSVDLDEIKGNCRYITPDRYEISLKVATKSNFSENNIGSQQDTMSLQTTVQLSRGERINVSSVVKNLKDQDQKVDLEPSIKLGKRAQKVSEKVFLSFP
jgi:hypothetical protein